MSRSVDPESQQILEYLARKRSLGAVEGVGTLYGVTPGLATELRAPIRRPIALASLFGPAGAEQVDRKTREALTTSEVRTYYTICPGSRNWMHVTKTPLRERVAIELLRVPLARLTPVARDHLAQRVGEGSARELSDPALMTWLKLQALSFHQPGACVTREDCLHAQAGSVRTVSRHLKELKQSEAVSLERTSRGLRVWKPEGVLEAPDPALAALRESPAVSAVTVQRLREAAISARPWERCAVRRDNLLQLLEAWSKLYGTLAAEPQSSSEE
ncbi:MAG TPA: hypothetical protein DEA08_37340 [Planctomycetes bacterium]|nr:hypothetical protein [Planctomycetota bacterium]